MSSRRLFTVRPTSYGWAVVSEDLALRFESGAKAEACARGLAQAHAARGARADVRILLRDGSLGGAFRYGEARALEPAG